MTWHENICPGFLLSVFALHIAYLDGLEVRGERFALLVYRKPGRVEPTLGGPRGLKGFS